MYREGPNGYNVPYGHYAKTPTIITRDELDSISDLIKDVAFEVSDFEDSMKKIREVGDFVYIDPPYAPETTKSFVGYVADGFSLETHQKLFDCLKALPDGTKFVMSNAKVDMVTDAFGEYEIKEVSARRAINSKNPGAKTTEVLITNPL